MNIFVGNLAFSATEVDVRKLFEGFGGVASVKIAMEKKQTKSRGFGFVQMPDEQLALAAIAALNGKEFMGRVINVDAARTKPEVQRARAEAKKTAKTRNSADTWYNPVFNKKTSRYKTGRRSRSFMKRRAASGIADEAMPKKESRDNPMRWRKKHEQPKPWQKSKVEAKPRRKPEGASGPRRENKKRPRPRQSRIESRRKPGGYTR